MAWSDWNKETTFVRCCFGGHLYSERVLRLVEQLLNKSPTISFLLKWKFLFQKCQSHILSLLKENKMLVRVCTAACFNFCCGLNTNIYTMATANWINIDVYWLEKKTEIKRNISWDCKLCMFRCQTFWFRSFRKITAKLRQSKKVSVWELFGVKLVCKAAGENLLRVDKSFM